MIEPLRFPRLFDVLLRSLLCFSLAALSSVKIGQAAYVIMFALTRPFQALHAEPLSSGPQTQDFASVARTLEATLSASYSKKTAVQEEILKSETLPVTKDPSAILLRALKPALSQPPTPAVPHAVGAATEPNVPDRKHAASVAPTPSVERAAHSGIISHSADAALMQAHMPVVEALSPPVTRKRGALNTSVESSDFPHIANQIKLAAASPPKGPTLNIAQSPVVPPRIVEEPRKDEQSPPTPSLSDPVSPPSSVFQIELVKEEVTLAAPTGDTARIQSVPPKMPPLSLNGSPLSGSLSSPHFERRTSQATPVASSAPSEPSALRTATESFSPLPGSVLASRDNDGAAVAPSSPRKRTGLPPLAIPARPEMSATDGVRMTPRGTASQTPRTASTPRGSQARPDKMETPRGSLRPPEQETPRSLSTPRGRDGLTTPRGTRRDTNASEGTGRVTPRGGLTTPRGSPVPSLGALPPHRVEEKEKAAAAVEGARIEKTSSASADNSAKPERLAAAPAAAAHGEEGGKMERVASSERVDKDRPMPAHVERDGKKEASASPSPARPVPTALAIPRLSSSPAQASSLEKRLAMSYTELPSAPLAQSSPKQRHGQVRRVWLTVSAAGRFVALTNPRAELHDAPRLCARSGGGARQRERASGGHAARRLGAGHARSGQEGARGGRVPQAEGAQLPAAALRRAAAHHQRLARAAAPQGAPDAALPVGRAAARPASEARPRRARGAQEARLRAAAARVGRGDHRAPAHPLAAHAARRRQARGARPAGA